MSSSAEGPRLGTAEGDNSLFGSKILVDSMIEREGSNAPFKHGNRWQYHSRSDHHSKVACWGLMLDLLLNSSLLRRQAEAGKIGFGLNHELRDFGTNRKKDLDLVICTPRSSANAGDLEKSDFTQRAEEVGVVLDSMSRVALGSLPKVNQFPVGTVRVAVEAKACMTAHVKALPRLYDELNSSHLAIHGSSTHAVAVGLALVNASKTFVSPGKNDFDRSTREPIISQHRQPDDTRRVIEKLNEIRRRTRDEENGFDAFGITVIECVNDGSLVKLVESDPAPKPEDIYHYESMVRRVVNLYEQKFSER